MPPNHSVASHLGTLKKMDIKLIICLEVYELECWTSYTTWSEVFSGPMDKSLSPVRSSGGTCSRMCVHRGCPAAAARAGGRCGKQGHRPPHPGNCTSGFLWSSAAGHTQSTGGSGKRKRRSAPQTSPRWSFPCWLTPTRSLYPHRSEVWFPLIDGDVADDSQGPFF